MTEVYFDDIHSQIIKQISAANFSVKICVAWFTDIEIYRNLIELQKNGVCVSIIVANHELNKRSRVDFKELLKYKGSVGYIGDSTDGSKEGFMHNKFCIIDNNTVITGSYNWTYKARLNEENIIIIKNQFDVTSKYNSKFESIKPKFRFAVNRGEVKLLPIEKIMAKWETEKEPKLLIQKNSKQSIIDKF